MRNGGQEVETEVATGDPARLLVEILESHGCHAVIMAGSGTGGASIGSVASGMLELSAVPVTLVKPPAVNDSED